MKIGIATPCYDGRVHDAHMHAILKLWPYAAAKGVELEYLAARGCAILPDVRNFLVAQAFKNKCDKVLFLDSDISIGDPEVFLNFLMSPVPIVAGVPQGRNSTWNAEPRLIVRWDKIPPEQDEDTGLWIVEAAATACLLIDMDVFRTLAAKGLAKRYIQHGQVDPNDIPALLHFYNFFDYEKVEMPPGEKLIEQLKAIGYEPPYMMNLGEDFYFCRQARAAGFRILVDPRIHLVHFDGCVQHNAHLGQVSFQPGEVEVRREAKEG